MKYCPNCGKQVVGDADFCPNCGFHLKKDNTKSEELNTQPTQSRVSRKNYKKYNQKKHLKRNIGFSIIGLVLVIGIIWFLINTFKSNKETEIANLARAEQAAEIISYGRQTYTDNSGWEDAFNDAKNE